MSLNCDDGECTDVLPQGETSRIEKRCYGSVVESVICRVGGVDGSVAAVRCGSSRGDPPR